MVLLVILTAVWADVAMASPVDQKPSAVAQKARAVAHRSGKEMLGGDSAQQQVFDLKTTGQKWSSDDYQTLSSLTSVQDDRQAPSAADNSPPEPPKIDVYPVLTTDVPPYTARNKYVRNPAVGYLHTGRHGHGYQETGAIDDQRSEYTTGNANVVSKWNRYGPYRGGLRMFLCVFGRTIARGA